MGPTTTIIIITENGGTRCALYCLYGANERPRKTVTDSWSIACSVKISPSSHRFLTFTLVWLVFFYVVWSMGVVEALALWGKVVDVGRMEDNWIWVSKMFSFDGNSVVDLFTSLRIFEVTKFFGGHINI